MQIDPTNWPKVEACGIPSKGRYWCVSKESGDVHLSSMFNGNESYNDNYTLYGPIEFVPPKVIPPRPENALRLMELTRVVDSGIDVLGDVKWCAIDSDGYYWPMDLNGVVIGEPWLNDQCKEVNQ